MKTRRFDHDEVAFAIFANTGHIEAFNDRHVLWSFSSHRDKRWVGRDLLLYVIADYFGEVQESHWQVARVPLPPKFSNLQDAPTRWHTKPVKLEAPVILNGVSDL